MTRLVRLAQRWHSCAIRMPSRVMALAWVPVGLAYLVDGLTDWAASPETDAMPAWLLLTLGPMLAAAGLRVTIAVLSDPPNMADRWANERLGWYLGAGAWGLYVLAYAALHASSLAGIVLPLSWAISGSYAIRRLNAAETRARTAAGEADL